MIFQRIDIYKFTKLLLLKKGNHNILADYDYINGKKCAEVNETKACPQCGKFASESNASRRDHYVRVGWFPKYILLNLGE